MRPVQIITDSCSDMSRDLRTYYNIDYVRMKTVWNGEEMWANLDFEDYTPKALYEGIRKGDKVITKPVPASEFEEVFVKYLSKGFDIVYVGCSLKQSTSVNDGKIVAAKVLEDFPQGNIFCVDSKNASMGEGLVAILAAKYRDMKMSARDIAHNLVDETKIVNQFCTVQSLDCLRRCGRVKAGKAFFGNLFDIKPIIISDKNGNQVPVTQVKGRAESLNELIRLLKEALVNSEDQDIFITHADCGKEAMEFAQHIMREIKCKNVHLSYIGPIIGASLGPSGIAVFGYGNEVTYEG